jgi:hypothetical protein
MVVYNVIEKSLPFEGLVDAVVKTMKLKTRHEEFVLFHTGK